MIKKQHVLLFALLATLITTVAFFIKPFPTPTTDLHSQTTEETKDTVAYDPLQDKAKEFSINYPEGWNTSYYSEDGYESLSLKSLDTEHSTIGIVAQAGIQGSKTDQEYRDSFVDDLLRSKKEYEINNSGKLDFVNKIQIQGFPGVRYTIYTIIPGSGLSEIDSVFVFKEGRQYLLRLTTSAESQELLSEKVKTDVQAFDSVIESFQFIN